MVRLNQRRGAPFKQVELRAATKEDQRVNVPAQPGGKLPAPGDLLLVQLFVNSLDIEAGIEQFGSPSALSAWLYQQGLTSTRAALTEQDLERAQSFRELLRALALANNGGAMTPDALGALDRELGRLRFHLKREPTGEVQFGSSQSGVDEALGTLLAIVSTEMIRGRWSRMKACSRDVCRWVFYDHSRNRTGTWCSMAICGSRTKVGAYYRRHRRTRPSGKDRGQHQR
jgi:predicted RNA-binding Zn ribbon-like protein